MDLEARIGELAKRVSEHREILLTEEAAKAALVMPFLQILGYDVFNPAEVVPEFTCDVGTKKGEKVDYAICLNGSITILVECKPASVELNINHASQLFRYFSVTDARLAILTNGVDYKFFSDIDTPNKMDDRPFFSFNLESARKSEIKTLGGFTKQAFDIDRIVHEAGRLKLQSLVYKALQTEMQEPSDDLVRLVASRIHKGRVTADVKDTFKSLISTSFSALIRDQVTARLTTALSASNPPDEERAVEDDRDEVVTTEDEIAGFNIVRAIGAKLIDPKRIIMRDAKSYCAVLLDDNNRKTIARLHFNSPTARYVGTFSGKDETRHPVSDPVDLYQHDGLIAARLRELLGEK